jgi:methionyl-tRNA synthetase
LGKRYYITTPIYYINDVPHIGHAYTTIAADIMARYKRLHDYEVFFLTGVDEHGQKAEKAALARGIHPQELAESMVHTFTDLWTLLNISNTAFLRTTEERHRKVVQHLFQKIEQKGEIYLGHYEDWYCVPCESYFTELQLKEGRCPDCNRPLEKLREESYFFRMSAYTEPLLAFLANNTRFVMPDVRYNEVTSFVKGGLRDLSISRTSFQWGIPVPGNPQHVIYVWFDALANYLTGVGFLDDDGLFNRFWPCDAHLIGKDILRHHAVYWPSFLMSAGIELPKTIFAHGWWTVEGQKMSKSLGNVIAPEEVVSTYGVDQFRFFLFREVPFGLDGDFSRETIVHRINGDLANDFGNLVSRSLTMINKFSGGALNRAGETGGTDEHLLDRIKRLVAEYEKEMEGFGFHKALFSAFEVVSLLNKYVDTEAPWRLAKENPGRLPTVLYNLWNGVRTATVLLHPFMPQKTEEIWKAIGIGTPISEASMDRERAFYHADGLAPIEKVPPLFPRIAK